LLALLGAHHILHVSRIRVKGAVHPGHMLRAMIMKKKVSWAIALQTLWAIT
jgi:hypothetical protein